jgi:L-asparaginase
MSGSGTPPASPPAARLRPTRPRIAVIFTGGTISMTVDGPGGGAIPTLAGADLLARMPGLDAIAEVVPIDRGRTPASHFSFADVLSIGAAIDTALRDPEVAGVVIVQGTDTLEETAFAWDLCHSDQRPVVVTGAMRNASDPGWDGPTNLRAALRLAAHPAARGAGVVVLLGGRAIAADDVAKRHSTALDAFASRSGQPLGRVGERRLTIRRRGPRRRILPVPTAAAGPIAIVVAAIETDGHLLDRAVGDGARGVVVAATGSGNTHPDLLRAAVDALAAGIPIALASRTGAGPVGPFYAFPGGSATWQRAGVLMAGSLTPVQARVALALGLGAGIGVEELRALLADPVGDPAAPARDAISSPGSTGTPPTRGAA